MSSMMLIRHWERFWTTSPVSPSSANGYLQDDEDLSSTTSIGSSILRYRQENGRTYHAYKDGSKNISCANVRDAIWLK